MAGVTKVFSRIPRGGGYVQDALRRDGERLRALLAQGAVVRVCGSRAMAATSSARYASIHQADIGRAGI